MSGKATLPVRGGGVSVRGRGATSNVGRGSPCTREGASTRPSATRVRASPAKNVSMQSRTKQPSSVATSSVSSTKTRSAHKSGSCARTNSHLQPPKIPDKHLAKEAEIPVGPLNKPAYQPRLGLARVLVRKGARMEEIRKLYEEVISLEPEFHDAYIEFADCLIKTNPMKAVDVYSKYPFKENQSFDDAYIHGEIVRIIMKQEKYDDPRLGPSLISLGKTMGLTVIENYVETLDKTFKYSKLLCQVYASVHGKDVDDPDLQQFFKFKCWI